MNHKKTVEGAPSELIGTSRRQGGPYEALADDQRRALAYVYGKRDSTSHP